MLFHLYVVSCIIVIFHYNGLLRSSSASTFNQSLKVQILATCVLASVDAPITEI